MWTNSLRRVFALLCVIFATFACTSQPARAPRVSAGDFVNQTVALYTTDRPDSVYCTGVWVAPHLILTAAHCTQDSAVYSTSDEYLGVDVQPKRLHYMSLKKIDRDHDLALYLTGIDSPAHQSASFALGPPKVGDELNFMGHNRGMSWSYKHGYVSQFREVNFAPVEGEALGPWMQVSAPIDHGDSGGGAYNAQGELVGIASRGVTNVCLYVHLDTIKGFVNDVK